MSGDPQLRAQFAEDIRAIVRRNDLPALRAYAKKCDMAQHESFALRHACEKDRPEMVAFLLPLSDPLAKNSHALRIAICNHSVDVARLLIRYCAAKSLLEPVATLHLLAMTAAAGSADITRMLAARSAPPGPGRPCPLQIAVLRDQTEVVEALLGNAEQSDPVSVSNAIAGAASKSNPQLVKRLLGAHPPKSLMLDKAIYDAAIAGCEKSVDLLLPLTAPQIAAQAMRSACASGSLSILVKLIEKARLDPAAFRTNVNIALSNAATNGHTAQIAKLLAHSPSQDACRSALSAAVKEDRDQAVAILLPAVAAHRETIATDLRVAIKRQHLPTVGVLLSAYDPSQDPKSAAELAARMGGCEILKRVVAVSDPERFAAPALVAAATFTNPEALEYLLSLSPPPAAIAQALAAAAQFLPTPPRLEILQILMPHAIEHIPAVLTSNDIIHPQVFNMLQAHFDAARLETPAQAYGGATPRL